MLDRKSFKLLRKMSKVDYLLYDEINHILGTDTDFDHQLNKYVSHLISLKYIEPHATDKKGEYNSPIYNGYEITLYGMAYVDDKMGKFLGFLIPYAITTLVAIIALFKTG